jgi:predicted DNA-binding protein (MmcQ/YjbR family)
VIVDLATLRALVSELPGSREDVKWGADLCFCVGPKMYCVYGLESGGCSFKTDPETFARLCTRPGWGPAPYVARYHWVRIEPGTDVDPAELRALVTASYTAVARGLKKADRPAPAP